MSTYSGNPHILLFERDQQLTALLMSELQLAGYECHAARTAVEVFDAIARFPIRLVLVNLAQAAAGRREFWVALDAQRRGRGVQVFTFRCMNIAGYGVDDPDERVRIVLTDMEVDGMLGVMNLVDAVRARIPGPGSSTGSFTRVGPPAEGRDSARLQAIRPASQPGFSAAPVPSPASQRVAQTTAPLSVMTAPPPASVAAAPVASVPPIAQPSQSPQPQQPQQAAPTGGIEQPVPPRAGVQPSSFTDKIRAVIRPANRGTSANSEARLPTQSAVPAIERATPSTPRGGDTGLAQLTRMVEENMEPPSFSDLPLRASPIEDLPIERFPERKNGAAVTAGTGGSLPTETAQEAFAPTLQLASVNPPSTAAQSQAPSAGATAAASTPPEEKQPAGADDAQAPAIKTERDKQIDAVLVEQGVPEIAGAADTAEAPEAPDMSAVLTAAALRRRSDHSATSEDVLLNIVQSLPPMNALPAPETQPALLQAQVLSGRATRSLANVLLDGHLVPKDRLEVAQSIQRMLRGVDMNYQLGEILLMFKLLTPDQLLAASLVSYGLISANQISALGRIRQELHSMGLEYDLESLLVLFRMLTPEQLREVRASWTG